MKRTTYLASIFAVTVVFIAAMGAAAIYSSRIGVIAALIGYYIAFRLLEARRAEKTAERISGAPSARGNAFYTSCPWCGKPIAWRPRFWPSSLEECPHCGNKVREASGPRWLLALSAPLVFIIIARAAGALYGVSRGVTALAALAAAAGLGAYYFLAHLERDVR